MEAFKAHVNISDDELKALLDAESWLSPQEALEKGFATSIKAVENSESPSQSVRNKVIEMLIKPSNSVSLDDVLEKLNAALAKNTTPNAEPQQEQEQPQKPKENKILNLLNALAKC